MQIGRIVGTLVATRKDDSLAGTKLMVTQPLNLRLEPEGSARVMVDTVGAGVGELVIYTAGTAARNAAGRPGAAIDAAIVGIVDSFEVGPQYLDCGAAHTEGDEHVE
ncbi:MAG: EutN/CcmL family microcompartment protein [Bacillota bacterium]